MKVILECPNCKKPVKNHSHDNLIKCLTDMSGSNRILYDEEDSELAIPRKEEIYIVEYYVVEDDKTYISLSVGTSHFDVDVHVFDRLKDAINKAYEKRMGGIST